MVFNLPSAQLSALLGDLIGEEAVLDPATLFVGLFTEGPTTTPPTALTDFTFPLVTSFARVAVESWNNIDAQPDGSFQVTGNSVMDFVFSLYTSPTNFVGAYIASASTAGTLIAWGLFDDIVQFLSSTAHARFVPRLTVGPDASITLDMIRVDEPVSSI